jgi:lysophospholipid acyltransferase (LPLAT)-like uncharacterized protein
VSGEHTSRLVAPGSALAAGVLAALASSWRLERTPEFEALDREFRGGRQCILVFWHARMLPLAWTHRGRKIVVLVSRHGDGEWIARVLERVGNLTARGSSTRGGEAGVMALLAYAAQGRTLAITPDGPRGPAERVKTGAVYLAARTGLPLVPLTVAADRAWVLRSWDRFRVPQPFARMRLAYGTPIEVPRDVAPEAIETWRARLERALDEVTRETAAAVGEPPAALLERAPEGASPPRESQGSPRTVAPAAPIPGGTEVQEHATARRPED